MKKIFFRNSIILSLVIVFSVMAYNFCLDFYGVFWRDGSNIFFTPNNLYVKLNHVIKNRQRYDSLIFGSSRVGCINAKKILNGKYYNMFYFCGLPNEWLRSLEVIIDHKVELKNIIIGMDEFSYKSALSNRRDMPAFKFYPLTLKEKIYFYTSYLFEKPSVTELIGKYNEVANSNYIYDFGETGNFFRPLEEKKIEKNPEKHRNQGIFSDTGPHAGKNRMESFLDELKQIQKICKNNNISLTILMNPVHINIYSHQDIHEWVAFKKKLAEFTDYYDFSSLTPLVLDNYYFYDPFHYRHHIGDLMLSRIFDYPRMSLPEWFGIKVTRKNVDTYTDLLLKQLNQYKKTKELQLITPKDLL